MRETDIAAGVSPKGTPVAHQACGTRQDRFSGLALMNIGPARTEISTGQDANQVGGEALSFQCA